MSKKIIEPLLEPASLSPIYADRLSGVIPVGSVTHLIFSARQPSTMGGLEHLAQVRLIVPTDQLQTIGRLLLSGRHDIPNSEEVEQTTMQ